MFQSSEQLRNMRWKPQNEDSSHATGTIPGKYWCERAIIVEVRGPYGSVRRRISKPYALIGAHPRADILLSDGSAAKRELYLHATDVGVYAINLSAPSSQTVPPLGWVSNGKILTIGNYQLRVRLDPEPAEVASDLPLIDARESFPEPRAQLMLTRAGRLIAVKMLTRIISLAGRFAPCSLRVPDPSVSAAHCAVFWDGRQLWVIDLYSGNGTLYQKRPIDAIALQANQTVEMGAYGLTLKSLDPVDSKIAPIIGKSYLASRPAPEHSNKSAEVGPIRSDLGEKQLERTIDSQSVLSQDSQEIAKLAEWDAELSEVVSEHEKYTLTEAETASADHAELQQLRSQLADQEQLLLASRTESYEFRQRISELERELAKQSSAHIELKQSSEQAQADALIAAKLQEQLERQTRELVAMQEQQRADALLAEESRRALLAAREQLSNELETRNRELAELWKAHELLAESASSDSVQAAMTAAEVATIREELATKMADIGRETTARLAAEAELFELRQESARQTVELRLVRDAYERGLTERESERLRAEHLSERLQVVEQRLIAEQSTIAALRTELEEQFSRFTTERSAIEQRVAELGNRINNVSRQSVTSVESNADWMHPDVSTGEHKAPTVPIQAVSQPATAMEFSSALTVVESPSLQDSPFVLQAEVIGRGPEVSRGRFPARPMKTVILDEPPEVVAARVPEVTGQLTRLGENQNRRRRLIQAILLLLFLTVFGGAGYGLWYYQDYWVPKAFPVPNGPKYDPRRLDDISRGNSSILPYSLLALC